jgi:MOSC domain-containing protein YiiM
MGRIEALWIADEGSAPMQSLTDVEAVADRGFRGDRYLRGTGYYSPYDVCETTFIEREAIERIREERGIDLTDGRHRRNAVTSGVAVHDLLDQRFRVGGAVFEGTRPRPPCAHVEDVAGEDGVGRALTDGRGGICARVVEGGRVAVGDDVDVLGPVSDPDDLAAAIRERRDSE